jgi:hypothetical protein
VPVPLQSKLRTRLLSYPSSSSLWTWRDPALIEVMGSKAGQEVWVNEHCFLWIGLRSDSTYRLTGPDLLLEPPGEVGSPRRK